MKIIKKLSDYIENEIDDAKKYARCSLEYKESEPNLSKLFYTLATEEMDHMSRLHKAVTEIIEEYLEKNGEPPAQMQAVYDYLHEKHIDNATEVKTMLAMYKE